MSKELFKISPSSMPEDDFVELFGGVYEHTPWIAAQTWRTGLNQSHDRVAQLAGALAQTVDQASRQKQLDLILAHPDLAGKAAQTGELTAESTSEQAGAGIDQCTSEEFEKFQTYNDAYKKKFNIPFIMAVKGSNRHIILAAFEERLQNNNETELNRAIDEIHKIAGFRLEEIAQNQHE